MFVTFLCYRKTDTKHITGHIYDRLVEHNGADSAFLDVDDIPPGVDFRSCIEQQIARSDILLAIIGENWLNSRFETGINRGMRRLDDPLDFVRIEIVMALTRGLPVIPVLIDGTKMPALETLPPELRALAYLQAVDLHSGRDFRHHFVRLVHEIDRVLTPKRAEAARLADEARVLQAQTEARHQAELKRIEHDNEETHRQLASLRSQVVCPQCQTINPTRCAACNTCFVCSGDSPGWSNKIVLFGSGYYCSHCSAQNVTYGAS